MYKFLIAVALLVAQASYAQSTYEVPLTPEQWEFQEGAVEFIQHKGQQAVKLDENSGRITLKDYTFKDGTIEFDVEVDRARPFAMLHFRTQNENSEHIYLRTGTAGKDNAFSSLQYAPVIKTVNLWDLQHEYQTSASIKIKEWNHVKLVVSGKQLRVYVNGDEPNLEVPAMEGNLDEGSIALGAGFEGIVIFANLVIRPGITENLSPLPAPDVTRHDTRYLREWEVSQPLDWTAGKEVTTNDLPSETMEWERIESERRGLINLTRKFGPSPSRRLVWLKTTLTADAPQIQELKLGFSDEVWVFVNGKPVYLDKNLYVQNMRKSPDGRISIDNSRFPVSLVEGENTLLIAVANDFFGWGIMARLEHLEGITY